ncbi:hypothetical protein PVAP13_4KG263500 [Panicum virgatum]|uniref:Uncharacterized protein n=1 Tax=Panicum virgatum TaxID=38727 RepID=A0A8T0TSX7_PANVG|nr:hypothetical protein PVAP13_4KG263500 [Panicum virgatum]
MARIAYLTMILFLVLTVISSTSLSCQAGGCISCPRQSPPTHTCLPYPPPCTPQNCANFCAHMHFGSEGAYCKQRGRVSECCCLQT